MRFLISLCLNVGNPPLGQFSACSMVKSKWQVHLVGNRSGSQPYLRQRASLKSPLCKANPYSFRGKVVGQLEEPFSVASSLARLRGSGSWIWAALLGCCSLLSDLVFIFLALSSVIVSSFSFGFCSRMRVISDSVMSFDA